MMRIMRTAFAMTNRKRDLHDEGEDDAINI